MNKTNYDYPVKEIVIDEIINNIKHNEDDGILIKSIISELEKNVAETIRAGECANIPRIGCVKINSIKRTIYSSHLGFKIARKNMTKEEYKQHVGSWVIEHKIKQKEKEENDKYLRKLRAINKKKYDFMFTNINKSYADMFIFAITKLDEIPFDKDFEELYQSLKDEE